MQPGVVIQEAVPQWYQMTHDLEKVAKRLDADRWPQLQARLKKRELGFVQKVAGTKETANIAGFLTPEMHVAFLLSPPVVVKKRVHEASSPAHGVRYDLLYQKCKRHLRQVVDTK